MPVSLKIGELAIENTRGCNQSCVDCMRGKAQKVNICLESIKRLLKNPNYKIISIDNLYLTGGEPLLYPEAIITIVEQLIDLNIEVNQFRFITNGLINNDAVNEKLKEYLNYCPNILMKTFMDEYHKPIPNEIFQKNMDTGLYEYEEIKRDIVRMGRAKENKLGSRKQGYINLLYLYKGRKLLLESRGNNIFIPELYLSSKDKILGVCVDASWEDIDKNAKIDIYQNSIFDKADIDYKLYSYIKRGFITNLGDRYLRDCYLAKYNGNLEKFLHSLTMNDIRDYLIYQNVEDEKSLSKRRILWP